MVPQIRVGFSDLRKGLWSAGMPRYGRRDDGKLLPSQLSDPFHERYLRKVSKNHSLPIHKERQNFYCRQRERKETKEEEPSITRVEV